MIARPINIYIPGEKTRRFAAMEPEIAVMIGAFLLGAAIRIGVGGDYPLWFDESCTGAFAALPSLSDVLHQSLLDVNAPLYYVIAYATALVDGLSNQALRFPALIFGCIAPFLCLIPAPGVSRRTAMVWGAVISLWSPGMVLSQQARCYSLLLCLSVGATICFVRLLDTPNMRRAAAWALVACLAILTHYHASVLIGIQAITFLIVCKGRAVRTWPAAVMFLPAMAWLLIHGPRIAAFAAPNIAWYHRIGPADAWSVLTYTMDSPFVPVLLLVLAVAALLLRLTGQERPVETDPGESTGTSNQTAWIAVLCAVLGATIVIGLGILRPTFTPRYLVPFIPGILLGLVLICERLRSTLALAPTILVLVFALACTGATLARSPGDKIYNFETASDSLIKSGTRDLVFFWDHPATMMEDPSQLAIIGGFFFKRQGIDVHVTPLKIARHEDPNPRLIALADQHHAAILWLYDLNIHDTAARDYPPNIPSLAKGWTCRDFGGSTIGVLACSPPQPRRSS